MPYSNDIVNDARCYASCISKGMQMPVLISIFANISGMSTEVSDLVDGAKCYNQCIPEGMQLPVLIYLANEILISGGVGGGAQVFSGSGAPTLTPTVSSALYVDTDTGQIWQWYSSAWH